MTTMLQRDLDPGGEIEGAASSRGALESGIVAAQAGATAAALVEAACRATLLNQCAGSGAPDALVETTEVAARLRGRLEALLAHARAICERAPVAELPTRSVMDTAARRAALQHQASAIASTHDSIAWACADVLYLLRTLPASLEPGDRDAATGRLLAEAGLRTAVRLLEGDLAALSDPYARHAIEGHLTRLQRRLESLGARLEAEAR